MTDHPQMGTEYARGLDARDELASYREQFRSAEPNLIYMDATR